MSNKHPSLIEQKQALSAYFDALLQEEPEEQAVTEEALEEVRGSPVIAPPLVAPLTIPKVQEAPAVEEAVQVLPVEEGVPGWAEQEFQALLFRVGGLTLAVPLVELSGIQVWHEEKITPMPGHVSWYLGLMNYRERSVPVIDAAQLVLPEDKLKRLNMKPAERITRIVFIDEGRWGLACDQVDEVISLSHDQVRWRSSRTKRRWLAGTVVEHMCAIIDPPAFAEMLATGMEDQPQEGGEGAGEQGED